MLYADVSFWNRDSDGIAPKHLVERLAVLTGTAPHIALETTLRSYEGQLVEHHNANGNTSWILPLGVFHRTRRRFGLQCCPRCLVEARYFRRLWRLAFATLCIEHRCELIDRCRQCGAPLMFHRAEQGDRNRYDATISTQCGACGYDLVRTRLRPARDERLVRLQQSLERTLRIGYIMLSGQPIMSQLFFSGVHELARAVVSKTPVAESLRRETYRSADMRSEVMIRPARRLEELGVDDRRKLFTCVAILLTDWPERFVAVCRRAGALASDVLPAPRTAPYWYASVVRDHLLSPYYSPCIEEIKSVINWLEARGSAVNKQSVGELLGVSDWPRKRRLNHLLGEEYRHN